MPVAEGRGGRAMREGAQRFLAEGEAVTAEPAKPEGQCWRVIEHRATRDWE